MASKKEDLPEFWKTYEASFEKKLPEGIAETVFVVLDTETTGFSLKNDRMLSIGALRLINGSIPAKDAFEVFLKQTTFDAKTVEIHGILKKGKVKRIEELEGLKILLKLLENNAVIVAHHVGFDVGMINQALVRHGMPKLLNKTLDTAVLFNRSLPRAKRKTDGHYSLDVLCEEFNIPKTDRHTALGDAYITAIAFLRIMDTLKPVSLEQLLKRDRFWEFWKSF
ncbi:PolC-type DNA polymerase III [Flagellimonas meridianipacifica]|uniref:DNA polymerase-3 subunit epsilon n=1 Tax=Flagellimonas meridianipacifica TaxID=1080225 RepID=A0A2T0MCK3_9FLAO|nr:3'-5' exonuclease [Allomuricauda pacifica]PRX55228.1 DNA polymerase-3 subunit epsilon [Allomuricauda pacifica]